MWNTYQSSDNPHIGPETLRCVICGSPYGGFGNDGQFYCWVHLLPDEKIVY